MQAIQDESVTPLIIPDNSAMKTRNLWLTRLALLVAAAALVSGSYWILIGSKHVSTDNAYVAADIAQVSARSAGTVKDVLVTDTQNVKAGDVLVILDDSDANITLKQAEANAARADAEFDRAQTNLNRRSKLSTSGFVSTEELNNFENSYKVAKANADLAKASLEQAQLELQRTVIRAPIDGIVAKREVQLGQRIAPGSHLLSIVPVSQVYVNANFKEVQLVKVKVGQPVELHADLYGSKVTYHGKVVGVSGGTGSSFAILPAQNATGNWIKVVQRLPVRIELDKKNLAQYPLRVGLSMHADINIGKHVK
jgi:membrane fusion protein (multidrug efflux system)